MDTVALDLASRRRRALALRDRAEIEWSSALVSAVDLAYQTSAAGSWYPIADNVPDGPKSYVWVIPNAPSGNARCGCGSTGAGWRT
jgi:hypothetical protein